MNMIDLPFFPSAGGGGNAQGEPGYTPQKGTDYWTPDDVNSMISETTRAVLDEIGDKVVEQGEKGIWSYRKWESGLAECWGHIDFSSPVTMESGALFLSDKVVEAQNYPFTFAEVPMVNATIGGAQYMAFLMVAGMVGDAVTTTHSGMYRIARSTIAPAESNFVINYDVKGRWK